MGGDAGRVRVVVRARPSLPREVVNGKVVSCIGVDAAAGKVYVAADGSGSVLVDDTSGGDASDTQLRGFAFDKALPGDATEDAVYDGIIRESLQAFLAGYNTSIFAYGQTGSGKTHTMTHLTKRVLADILRAGEAACSGSSSDGEDGAPPHPHTVSVFQIYREVLTDLTQPGTPKLDLKGGSDAPVTVEGSVQCPFTTVREGERVIAEAVARRAVGATAMNDVSSRSHLIVQIAVKGVKLNLVDLAGSERVKQSRAEGERLKEAQSINASLFSLIHVVRALADRAKSGKPAHIPYRDSKLTHFLRDSLGGNCRTVLIATISPSEESASETSLTLKFATACGTIVNVPQKRPKKQRVKKAAPEPPLVAPWEGVEPAAARAMLETKAGNISVLHPQRGSGGRPPPGEEGLEYIFLLHGCPSEGAEYLRWFPLLEYCKLWPVAIDQPGFGKSPGEPRKSRSEYNLDAGGPVDILLAVMRVLNVKSAHLMGYDWGGGIILSAALKTPIRFKSVISIMPSFAEKPPGGELSGMKPPALILWFESDEFHSWKKWKPLAAKIPNATVKTLKAKDPKGPVSAFGSDICKFITGSSPLERKTTLNVAQSTQAKTISGEAITMVERVVMQSGLTDGGADKIGRENRVDGSAAASACVANFAAWRRSTPDPEAADAFRLCASGAGSGTEAKTLLGEFASLPTLSPTLIDDGTLFSLLGIWGSDAPRGKDALESSPRYFKGRQVLVRLPGVCPVHASPDYMKVVDREAAAGRGRAKQAAYVTHNAFIKSVGKDAYVVEVLCGGGGAEACEVSVPKGGVHALNQPHAFQKSASGSGKEVWHFEDGLRGSYDTPLVRAKLFEIALLLAPVVEGIDFSQGSGSTTAELQKKCVRIIRKALNCTTFASGVDRSRFGRTDDIAKLACYGQVQCHGGSSLMAFFLQPFSRCLGIDVRYRGGYTFGPGHEPQAEVSNDIEAHQWLELTLRPSCEVVVCDLFLDMIGVPVDQAYTGMMYPNGKLIIGTTMAPVAEGDVAS